MQSCHASEGRQRGREGDEREEINRRGRAKTDHTSAININLLREQLLDQLLFIPNETCTVEWGYSQSCQIEESSHVARVAEIIRSEPILKEDERRCQQME